MHAVVKHIAKHIIIRMSPKWPAAKCIIVLCTLYYYYYYRNIFHRMRKAADSNSACTYDFKTLLCKLKWKLYSSSFSPPYSRKRIRSSRWEYSSEAKRAREDKEDEVSLS